MTLMPCCTLNASATFLRRAQSIQRLERIQTVIQPNVNNEKMKLILHLNSISSECRILIYLPNSLGLAF